ncbi:MAG: vWA domain-containing protein [Myxococcota bacterium]
MLNRIAGGFLVLGLGAIVAGACNGNIGSQLDSNLGENDDGGDGGGATSGSDVNGIGGNFDPFGGDGGNGGDDSCAGAVLEPQTVPVSMFITVDKSGSMSSNNKWNNTRQAFSAFFTDAEADGLNVALRFWPDGSCSGGSCQPPGNGCEQPQVPMGSLADPAHEQALIDTFNSKSPGGLTPTEAALSGAVEFATNYQTGAEAAEQVVVILVTDGSPTQCNTNPNVISGYAADGFNNDGILTFAVGLAGSNEGQMNQIAQAGGTTQGYFIGNNNTEQALLQALKDIQQVAVACTFAMPESENPGETIDPDRVTVILKADDVDPGEEVPRVSGETACGTSGGWYYDDPEDPAVIFLCPATCDGANATETSKIEIAIGCLNIVD